MFIEDSLLESLRFDPFESSNYALVNWTIPLIRLNFYVPSVFVLKASTAT